MATREGGDWPGLRCFPQVIPEYGLKRRRSRWGHWNEWISGGVSAPELYPHPWRAEEKQHTNARVLAFFYLFIGKVNIFL
jgi:hypothetical protein